MAIAAANTRVANSVATVLEAAGSGKANTIAESAIPAIGEGSPTK